MSVILHVDQRRKQNQKAENLSVLPQEQNLLGKEFGPMLKQEKIRYPIMMYLTN